ncbi:MAG: tRNA (guanosine(37)-N1)-methyltransferase TrmD [Nitrococcus mobilis]|nr:tRNA (guanosine(37)-N1)-methyltransferase TrmD [Nitrococcus mobilis]
MNAGGGIRFDVITLFPDFVRAAVSHGIAARACARGLLQLVVWNPRDYARDRHRSVDDRPYGGGPGMVMKVEPLRDAIQAARAAVADRASVICLSPQGRLLDQACVQKLAQRSRLILLCGRYEGIDERLIETEVDEECSIGDYVLSGGELPAMVIIDAVSRLVPGVLGHPGSAGQDSFGAGLLDCPHYTRPVEIGGRRAPEVLLSGDHQAVARWRHKQALGRTWLRRPDLLARCVLDAQARLLLQEFIDEYQGDSGTLGETRS